MSDLFLPQAWNEPEVYETSDMPKGDQAELEVGRAGVLPPPHLHPRGFSGFPHTAFMGSGFCAHPCAPVAGQVSVILRYCGCSLASGGQ
uniref:Uncharacterized protein n=2 Tax=Anas TaxID=8835 RepID=A0A8B9VP68_9AVES